MRYASSWLIRSLLSIASWSFLSPVAIAHPRAISLPAHIPVNRLSRDLTRSASEDFFRQGQARLEQEIQRLAKNRDLTPTDLLKVSPSERSFSEEIERGQPRRHQQDQ